MSVYTSIFADTVNGVNYQIKIETAKGTGNKELLLSGEPLVTNMGAEDDYLYTPLRTGGATIGVLTDNIISDLYTGSVTGNKVTVTNLSTNNVEWVGFVSPCMYDQAFDNELEEIQIECVDGIASLKDIPYWDGGNNNVEFFINIIFNCLKKVGCYRYLYVSDNVQMSSASGTEATLGKLRVSDSNFFDEADSPDQTADDLAWSCHDVLYHIAQFMGMTMFAQGQDVYMVDYDAIKKGNNTYHRYSLEGSAVGSPTNVTLSYNYHIDGASHAENGTSVSLTDVYNKVTVVDEFRNFDNLFPTFGDENFERNITAPSANLSSYFHNMSTRDHGLQFGDHIKADPSEGIYEDFCIIFDTDWYGNWWLNIFKFYESDIFNFNQYNRSTRSKVNITENMKYSDLLSYNGGFYYRWYKKDAYQWVDENGNKSNDIYEWLNRQKSSYNYNASTKDKMKVWGQLFEQIKMVDKLEMQPVIAFINAGDNRFGPADEVNYNSQTDNDVTKNYPFVTLKNYNSSVFGGMNHYLRIKGTFAFHDEWVTPHKLNDGKNNGNLKRKEDYKRTNQGYLWCKVKWGNRWWDGDGWKDSDCWFKLYYWNTDDQDNGRGLKNSNNFDKDFKFKSNAYSLMNLGEEGCLIPCPTDGNLDGTAEISFTTRDMWGDSRRSHWHPKGNKTDNFYCRYLSNCVFITDLEIKAETYEGFLNDANLDTDTVYTNIIPNGSVLKLDDITFKICSDDGKKPSYSCVDYLDSSGTSQYLKTTYNKALYSSQSGTSGTDGQNGRLRQEEHYVFKLASQYEEPRVEFKCNLFNMGHKPWGTFTDKALSGKTFVMKEMETDWKRNKTSLTLVEKA